MPIARFEMPDGRIGRFEVPEGTTPEQAQKLISEYLGEQDQNQLGRDIGRQLGLTARAATTGAAGLPVLAGDALNTLINLITGGVGKVTGTEIPRLQMPSQVLQRGMTQVGLPEAETKGEKVIQDITSAVSGVAAPAALVQRAYQAGKTALTQPFAVQKFLLRTYLYKHLLL